LAQSGGSPGRREGSHGVVGEEEEEEEEEEKEEEEKEIGGENRGMRKKGR